MKKTILFLTFLNASAPGNEVELDTCKQVSAAPSKKTEVVSETPSFDRLRERNPNSEIEIPNLGVRRNGFGSGILSIETARKTLAEVELERRKLEPFEEISPFLKEVLFTEGKSDDSPTKLRLELLANLFSDEYNQISTRHLERLGVEILLVRINRTCPESICMLQKYFEADSHNNATVVNTCTRDIKDLKIRLMRIFPKITETQATGATDLETDYEKILLNWLIRNLNNAKFSKKGEDFLKARAKLYKKNITEKTDRDAFLQSIPICIRLALLENAEEKTAVKRPAKYKTDVEETEALLPAASAAQRAERTPIQENLSGREAFELYFRVKYGINFTALCNGPEMRKHNEKLKKAREEEFCVAS